MELLLLLKGLPLYMCVKLKCNYLLFLLLLLQQFASHQYLSEQKAATPALIHAFESALFVCGLSEVTKSSRSDGSSIHMIKLEECPVVARIPQRLTTLYTGQR